MKKMKKLIITIALIIFPSIIISFNYDSVINLMDEDFKKEYNERVWRKQWDDLLDALIWVESKGDPTALGSCGDRGILQITPILVQEVNRLSDIKYTHDDAWDPEKSKEMFYIIAHHYCPQHDYEKMARIWNGGPKGYKKSQTLKYWDKVKNVLI